jgi:hypothetical protein
VNIEFNRGFVASAGFGTFMGVGGYSLSAALLVSLVSGLAGVWMGNAGMVANPPNSVEQFLANTGASLGAWWLATQVMAPHTLPAGNPAPRLRTIRRTR